jgi:hypothetical protein
VSSTPALAAGAPGVSSSQGEEAGRVLGDAGMVLRDPSTAHLLAHQVPGPTLPHVSLPPDGVFDRVPCEYFSKGILRHAA